LKIDTLPSVPSAQERPRRLFYDDYRGASVSVIVPVHNEEDAIVSLIQQIILVLKGLGRPWEVVIIDDGSTDGTLKCLEPLEVKVIAHPYNIGNGAAIKTGIRHACGEIILMMDGDGQHDPGDIPRLIEQIGPYDMSIGARSSGSQNTHRMVANQFYNLFASYVAHFFIRDLTSGFRAIKASVLKRFTYLLPNTFSYPTTLTLSLLRAGHSLCYEPIVAAERKSKSKIKPMRDGVRFLLIIFKIATFFSPLKIFLPFSVLFLAFGASNYAYTYYTTHRLTNMSVLCFIASFLFFLLGLISEQIAQLRFDRSEEQG
jgi:glycosyltransferase involved in cell wall biosynthesis